MIEKDSKIMLLEKKIDNLEIELYHLKLENKDLKERLGVFE